MMLAQSGSERAGVPRLPATLQPLFDYPLRDPSICLAPDGWYYLASTTGHPTWWTRNEGIRLWRSPNLVQWEPLGVVWAIDQHGSWHTERDPHGDLAVWAPEIHYLKGMLWLTYSLWWQLPDKPSGRCGLLRSTSGHAAGPYADVGTGPLSSDIDASLFQDDDGTVYWVYQNVKIARMTDDMTALAEEPQLLVPANHRHVGFEGAFIAKIDGRYHLIAAEFTTPDGVPLDVAADTIDHTADYHCFAASSDTLRGPYGPRYLTLPHAGHNMVFHDKQGHCWSTLFGNSSAAPFRERPAIV